MKIKKFEIIWGYVQDLNKKNLSFRQLILILQNNNENGFFDEKNLYSPHGGGRMDEKIFQSIYFIAEKSEIQVFRKITKFNILSNWMFIKKVED